MAKTFLISSKDDSFIQENITKLKKQLKIEDNSVDLLVINQGENQLSIGIDATRKLKQWLSVKPYNSPNKLAIITKADLLTVEAQNSILKQLEEPHHNHYVLLATAKLQTILPTVISRCELIYDLKYKDETNDLKLLDLPIEEQFLYIEKLLKTKDLISLNKNIMELLESLLRFFEKRLRNDYSNNDILNNIALINQTVIMMKSNTSKRLLLENLLINMKRSY